ncbi:hypothetical protein PT285_10255 [Lactobacillus sp. ESL0791]|uniref:hypothetical protein n=1 Tax=Lactobacillus sp. ESL0791 TaxID=2983234 RepID=UPI0023F7AB52|nr:hypothetical protein [Lactobacillus sp. ESL0791]MDF7639781.1 hypothetical protein [Lactobacillus sp. ESL0791]
MIRKKIEINDEIEKLAEKYADLTNKDLNEVINEALKFYLVEQLGSRQVKRALKDNDSESNTSKIIDQLLNSNFNDLNKY